MVVGLATRHDLVERLASTNIHIECFSKHANRIYDKTTAQPQSQAAGSKSSLAQSQTRITDNALPSSNTAIHKNERTYRQSQCQRGLQTGSQCPLLAGRDAHFCSALDKQLVIKTATQSSNNKIIPPYLHRPCWKNVQTTIFVSYFMVCTLGFPGSISR